MKFNNSISDTFIQNVSDPKNKFSKNVMPIFRAFGHHSKFYGRNYLAEFNSIQFKQSEVVGGGGNPPF